jgi:hypothetical protein
MLRAILIVSFSVGGAFAQDPQQISEVRAILREAGKLVPQMEDVQQPSAASNISGQQVSAGDLAGALETIRSVKQEQDASGLHGLEYSSLAWTLSKQGSWQVAMDLVRELPDGPFKALDYMMIAEQLAENRDFKNALSVSRLISAIPNIGSRFADTLVEISSRQFKGGDQVAAIATLQEAFDAVEALQKNPPGFSAGMWYSGAVPRLVSAGNTEAASLALERAYIAATQEKTPSRKADLLKLLAASQACMGDFAAALRSAEQLPSREQRDAAVLGIATEEARQGDTAGARRLAARVPATSWANLAIEEFAYALAKSGDSVRALETIKGIQAPGDRAYGLAQLALQQAERDDGFAGLTAILAMEAARLAGDSVEPFVFELIAVTRGTLTDFPGAEQIVDSLKDANRVWPLWNLTEQLVAAGKKQEALDLAHAQEFPRARGMALLGTATALLEQIEAARKRK